MCSAVAHSLDSTTPLGAELAALEERFGPLSTQDGAGGVVVVTIPNFTLPAGWSKPTTKVHFVVPVGYPHAQPDCFHTEQDLRLAGGGMPQNTAMQDLMPLGTTLWFSWHLGRPWKPGRDTLITWAAVIGNRFASLT